MRKIRMKKTAALFYAALGLCYFSVFLAVLCFWQTKQISYLTEKRRTEYRVLAAAEMGAAIRAYEDGGGIADVYHALRTAAEYYAMDGSRAQIGASVREISGRYLEKGVLEDADYALLRRLSDGSAEAGTEPLVYAEKGEAAAGDTSSLTEAVGKCRSIAEKIVGVRGICRQVYVERGGETVLFYFENGYIRLRLRDAVPIEWVFSYPAAKGQSQTAASLRQKAARCIPDVTLTIRDVRAAEEGYWMRFSGKPGSGRLFIRAADGRITAFFTDPIA